MHRNKIKISRKKVPVKVCIALMGIFCKNDNCKLISFVADTAYIELISYRLFASEYNYSLNLCFANRRKDNQTTQIHSATTYKFIQTLSSMHPYENPVLR